MNVTRKTAGKPHKVGDEVTIGSSGEIFTVHEVIYRELKHRDGVSRFDFYVVRRWTGEVIDNRQYVRADLRPVVR